MFRYPSSAALLDKNSDDMRTEFISWLSERFREQESAVLSEVQKQLFSLHKQLEKEAATLLSSVQRSAEMAVDLKNLGPCADLDVILCSHEFPKIAQLEETPPPVVNESVDEKPELLWQQNQTDVLDRIQDACHTRQLMPSPVTMLSGNGMPIDVSTVFQSVSDCDVEAVTRYLDIKGDPNFVAEYKMRGRVFTPCSILAVAVLNNQSDLVSTLIQRSAHPDSEYGFAVGATGMHWSGPCASAAIQKNNFEVLKLLLKASADLHARGSNDSTLMWECAYHGRADMLSHLLEINAPMETPAYHPDSRDLSHTPLHVGVLRGHRAVVSQLLTAKASTSRINEIGRTALDDAIIGCQPNLVSLLVGEGADLYATQNGLRPSEIKRGSMSMFKRDPTEFRPIDHAIELQNSVVMAAMAEGLARQENQVRLLGIRDCVYFLNSTGDSPANILNAMFRIRNVLYWEQSGRSMYRKSITTAFIQKPKILPNGNFLELVNVTAMSISYGDLVSKLTAKDPLDLFEMQQIAKLAPQQRSSNYFSNDSLMASVSLYECLISDVHRDLGVIAALSELDNNTLRLKPCQAILQQCWSTVKMQSLFDVFVHAALMLDFIVIGLLLHRSTSARQSQAAELDQSIRRAAGIGLVFSVTHLVAELLQCVAFYIQGWLLEYFADPGNYIDLGRIVADNTILMLVLVYGSEVGDARGRNSRIVLSVLAFYKWIKFLSALTPFRAFGPSILPILAAVRGSGPFLVVLSLCSLGLWHAYISLEPGRLDFFQSWFMIYRFSLFGEWEVEYEFTSSEQSYAVHTFFMVTTLMVTITLMNVFIAALSTSFSDATHSMVPLFERRRAKAILSNMAVREGIRHMSPCRRNAKDDSKGEILWFCCAAPTTSD